MAKVAIVGKTSFLARRLLALGTRHQYVSISHREIDTPGIFDGVSSVVNFAYNPVLRLEPYAHELDFDAHLATTIPADTHFVMLSSRMVYAPDTLRPCCEAEVAYGVNQYGKNKLATEQRLHSLLGGRLAVLRVANVLAGCGGPWSPTGYRSFIHAVLTRLKQEGRVVYDVSPFVQRDFVTDRYLVDAIESACTQRLVGTYNVGSGIGLEIGRIALWIMEGYGQGEFVVTSHRDHDAFWLNMSKSTRVFGSPPTHEDLRQACLDLGRRLAL